jgi:CheY-like chemotaxis protein
VLVVEDNHINQEVARKFLESLGCHVELVEDGQTAVDLMISKPYDIVFMDCEMPVLDGLQATRLVRRKEIIQRREGAKQSEAGRLPIIAMTAHASDSDRRQCLDSGMDDYISKPFSVEQLRRMLDRWL